MTRRGRAPRYSRNGALLLPAQRPKPRRALAAAAAAVMLAGLGIVAGPRVIGPARATTVTGSPIGVDEHMWGYPGGLRFIGWALDPNTAAPITVYFTIDGTTQTSTVADRSRPDVATAHPGFGPNHGFDTLMPLGEGTHTVCAWARNVGTGADTRMRCAVLTRDYGPVGMTEHIQRRPGALWVAGWTFDYDQPTAPVTVSIAIDNTITRVVASDPRPDIATRYPVAGPNHGYSVTIPVSQGSHSICVRGTSIGFGADNTFRCETVVLDERPLTGLNFLGQAADKLAVRGWTFDPDVPATPLTVGISIDGIAHSVLANVSRPDVGAMYPAAGANHGFDTSFTVSEGTHMVCVVARNLSFGSDKTITCRNVVISFTPAAGLTALTATATGATVAGWARDPDTAAAISARITVDGTLVKTVLANASATTNSGYSFSTPLVLRSGTHSVCAVAINVGAGSHDSAPACRTIALALKPIGHYDSLTRVAGSDNVSVVGWATDPDTTAPIAVTATVDGAAFSTIQASGVRTDVAAAYPAYGADHGIATTLAVSAGEHTVCLLAKNVGGGSDTSLGCQLVVAVHPVAPGAPTAVTATVGYGTIAAHWTKPASDGGAPLTSYTVTATPGGSPVTVAATATSVTLTGLTGGSAYRVAVTATNAAGTSGPGLSATVTPLTGPPPQVTPAPVSTSRYIRNISSASTAELALMRAEGAADAAANPSGHRYVILLDIGGQDQVDGGVVLSATTHFVPYATLVRDLEAYADGYHSAQRVTAPVTIAAGTNSDMDVSATSGAGWATNVVNPLRTYALRYAYMSIAGANDIEPGFRATYSATASWVSGFLGASPAPFIFNGSADGCSWTAISHSCNNGWTMAGLYNLAAGSSPSRMVGLPQIYNYTMADQWKYISLTGLALSHPRINFIGTLTEYTACAQAGSCGSITGNSAWSKLWADLQSDTRLKVASLPYSTDLRIN